MKKKWIFNIILFLNITLSVSVKAQSQTRFDLKNILSTSPEAASIGRYGDIPVGYYTGTADISIPFYTIKEAGIEIPIVLRYHTSGIKVEDQATNVGLGWTLEPGGAIIQVVNGKIDDSDQLVATDGFNFLKNTDPGYPAITTPFTPRYTDRYPMGGDPLFTQQCVSGNNHDTYQTINALEQGHGQPDIYQYNFPGGYSGKFYIDPETKTVVLIDKKEDIAFVRESGGWTATTMNGDKFYFTTVETAIFNGDTDNAGATFKLTKIHFNNGKEISFSYLDAYYLWNHYSETFHSEFPDSGGGNTYDNTVRTNSTVSQHFIKTISQISTDDLIVNFNLDDRIDMPGNSLGKPTVKKIKSIDIINKNTGKGIKSFIFGYDYFTGSDIGGSYLNRPQPDTYIPTDADRKRLKLLSVREIGYNESGQAVNAQPYLFTYNESVQLPLKTSFAKDFWGYYNGKQNTMLLPDLSFFYFSDDAAYQQIPEDLLTRYSGANRSPDSTLMKAWILKRITYPTGGYTDFDYQSHDFSNHIYPDANKMQQSQASFNVADHNTSTDQRSANFSITSAQSVYFQVEFSRGPNTSISGSQMGAGDVTLSKVLNGTTSIVKIWHMGNGDIQNFDNNGTVNYNEYISLPYEAGAIYTITANMPDAFGEQTSYPNYAHVSCYVTYHNISPGYLSDSYGGGLRITTISNYNASQTLANRKVIKYVTNDNATSGILMSPLRFLYAEMMYSLRFASTTYDLLASKRNVWSIASESAVPLSDGAQGQVVGYSRVEEAEWGADNSSIGKHIYIYNNLPSECATNLPDNPSPLNGMLAKEEFYAANNSAPLQTVSYAYKQLSHIAYSGYKVSQTFVGNYDVSCGDASDNGFQVHSLDYKHSVGIHIYPIHAYMYKLSGKTTTLNNGGTPITVSEQYSYNSKGQTIRTDMYDSKEQKRSVLFLYPVDNPNDVTSAALINDNLYNSLQQQTTLLNDNVELEKDIITYGADSDLGQVIRQGIKKAYKQATAFVDVTFDRYGPYKTLRQFTQKGSPVVLLWGYQNQYPIAEIRNATYQAVTSALTSAGINAESISNQAVVSMSDLSAIRSAVHTALPNTEVTTFTYEPLVGMTSMTDARGMSTTYEYDAFQRLMNVRDKDGNIIKHIEYHYQNQ